MGHIDWIPIAEMPDALKDGRQVLLWDSYLPSADVGTWAKASPLSDEGWQAMYDAAPITDVTHFAEINPPDGEPWTPVFPGPLVWTEDYKGNP